MSSIHSIHPATAQTAADALRRERLKKSAGEFEAQMLSELLKPMQSDPLFSDPEQDSGASATIQGMATQALAQGMAAAGGVGIASRVFNSISSGTVQIAPSVSQVSNSGSYSHSGNVVTTSPQKPLND